MISLDAPDLGSEFSIKKDYTIKDEKVYSKCGWTPWNGIKVRGSQELVFLRGNPITCDYVKVVGSPGKGEFVKPQIEN